MNDEEEMNKWLALLHDTYTQFTDGQLLIFSFVRDDIPMLC